MLDSITCRSIRKPTRRCLRLHCVSAVGPCRVKTQGREEHGERSSSPAAIPSRAMAGRQEFAGPAEHDCHPPTSFRVFFRRPGSGAAQYRGPSSSHGGEGAPQEPSVVAALAIRDRQYGNAAYGVDRKAGRQSPVLPIDERIGDGGEVRDQEQQPVMNETQDAPFLSVAALWICSRQATTRTLLQAVKSANVISSR